MAWNSDKPMRGILPAIGLVCTLLFAEGLSADDWTPTWTTAHLSVARARLTAASADGKVFFAGGAAYTGYSATVDIYDPSNGMWTTAALSTGRSGLVSASTGSKVLFAGGGLTNVTSDVVDIYDVGTGVWSSASLSHGRVRLAGTSLANQTFFAGGFDRNTGYTSTVDIYNSANGSWSVAQLSRPRGSLAATAACGLVFFAGGCDDNSAFGTVDIFDTGHGSWSTATLSQQRYTLATCSAAGKVIFAGGTLPAQPLYSNVVDIYDTATGTWSTAVLSQARSELVGAAVGSKALFAGGLAKTGLSNVVDIYDAGSNTWSTASLSMPRRSLCAAILNDRAFFAGGLDSAYNQVDVVDIYTVQDYGTITSSQTWTLVDNTTVAGLMQLNAPGSLNLGTYGLTVGSMAGAAPISLAGQTLTVGGDNTSTTYSGAIQGPGTLTKTGTGRLGLSGAMSTLALNVQGGTLRLDLGGDVADGTPIRLAAGAVYQSAVAEGDSFAARDCRSTFQDGLGSAAALLAGVNASGETELVEMQWRARTAGDNGAAKLVSDVLSLGGFDEGDPYVLQLTYSAGALPKGEAALAAGGEIFVATFAHGRWGNAVLENLVNAATADQQGYVGSFASFQTLYGTDLRKYVGAWGVDPAADVAWSVLDHNSGFAVATPEPGTLAMLVLGGLGIAGQMTKRRQGRRRVGQGSSAR